MPALLLLAMTFTLGVSPSPEDVVAYESARAKVGHDSEAHVRLALWCESHGLQAEKLKHLAVAVLSNPSNASARGLLGLVSYRGKWQRPENLSDRLNADREYGVALERYKQKRAKAPYTADAHWKLVLWCEENGLPDAAIAHLWSVVRLDPNRDAAWKRLGFKKHRGRWRTNDQIAREAREAEAQKKANLHWRPLLEKWRGWLGDSRKRRDAEQALIDVTDPRAVPTVCAVFAGGDGAMQEVAARCLGQIDSPSASHALSILAIFGKSPEARRVAAELLRRRDARDFADILIGMMREPITYAVRPVGGPGEVGELVVEDEKSQVMRRYSPPTAPQAAPGDQLDYDAAGMAYATRVIGSVEMPVSQDYLRSLAAGQTALSTELSQGLAKAGIGAAEAQRLGNALAKSTLNLRPMNGVPGFPGENRRVGTYTVIAPERVTIPVGQMQADAQQAAEVARWQQSRDIEQIQRENEAIQRTNDRAHDVLVSLAEGDLGRDRESWQKWANDLRGYAFVSQSATQEKETFVEEVPIEYQPQAMPVTVSTGAPTGVVYHPPHSCFAKGTQVRALDGLRKIEDLLAGDAILTQETTSGILSYQPIVAVYHNSPNRTLRLLVGGESIVATRIHRFWKAGQGWTMARDLKPGDPVRTLGGIARVESITEEAVQPVFNLEVASGNSYFVGEQSLLVHDNSLIEPVTSPFDAPPTAAIEAIAK
ncbi:polymorphic toxin-type HINT domain-containing protein [Singulisphaera rosea]